MQETLGRTFVTVVTQEDVAEQRAVTMGPRAANLWIVEDGLRPGARVVVEGLEKARPGTRVAARMITEAQLASGTTEAADEAPRAGQGPGPGQGDQASPPGQAVRSGQGSAAGSGSGSGR